MADATHAAADGGVATILASADGRDFLLRNSADKVDHSLFFSSSPLSFALADLLCFATANLRLCAFFV
jgi:hypothetical protein